MTNEMAEQRTIDGETYVCWLLNDCTYRCMPVADNGDIWLGESWSSMMNRGYATKRAAWMALQRDLAARGECENEE